MFQEPLADYLKEHFQTHIEAYLEDINNAFPAVEREAVRAPKTIETASIAGGVFSMDHGKLPAFAIDVNNKKAGGAFENLELYQYDMQIAAVVISQSQESVDAIAKRYQAATELFFKRHGYLHQFEPSTHDFSVVSLVFVSTQFSGAMEITVGKSQHWIDGFVVSGIITTSEDGPGQHE